MSAWDGTGAGATGGREPAGERVAERDGAAAGAGRRLLAGVGCSLPVAVRRGLVAGGGITACFRPAVALGAASGVRLGWGLLVAAGSGLAVRAGAGLAVPVG
jgi:hypothetical protein